MRTSLNLNDQDVLVVHSWNHVTDLAADIGREAAKVGAEVQVAYFDDRLWSATMVERDEKYASRKSPIAASLAEVSTAEVTLWGPQDPKVFDRAKPARMAAFLEWWKEIADRKRERKVRSVSVALGQVTPQRARKYGVSYPKWKRIVTEALKADHKKIAATGQLVGKKLAGASEVRVTADDTDLTLSLSGREAFVDDGIIDANDIARGDLDAVLPTGKVEIAAVETRADGRVRFPTVPLWGKMIRGLEMRFEGGRLVEFEAEKNLQAFAGLYEPAAGDKDRIGTLSIGLNPKASFLGGFVDPLVAGAVTIGIGMNEDLGGTNRTPFGFGATLPRATVRADGTTIVEVGRLKP